MVKPLRWLIWTHRYLGIAVGLLCVMWFVSGIVMIYTGGMPALTPSQSLQSLPELALSQVSIAPAEAVQGALTLTTVLNRPVWRAQGGRGRTVFADDGTPLQPIDAARAQQVAADFLGVGADRLQLRETLQRPDQWTLGQRGTLFHFGVDDGQGSQAYVSAANAQVVQLTTRNSRALAWVGAIPHWLYFRSLRTDAPLWTRVVIWSSAAVCALAVMGVVLAFTQFRRSRPFRLFASIPYRGWMRWHYILGALFGVFAITWAFSGLLSMEPFAWTRATGLLPDADVMSGGSVQPERFALPDAAAFQRIANGRPIKQLELTRIQDEPYYVVRYVDGEQLVDATTMEPRQAPFSNESLVARLTAALPEAPLLDQQLLTQYDSYYYARGAPLPVLRIRFNDPDRTWFYVDPQRGEIVAQVHRRSRVERWLYHGLHSLDFPFWYSHRPLWDIGVIALCLGGAMLSGLGVYLGFKRLSRGDW